MILALLSLLVSVAHAEPTRVVVLDTGLDLNDRRFSKNLCPSGHKDFSGEGIEDIHGHGTHVVGLIQEFARNASYCLVIVKYYSAASDSDGFNAVAMKHALRYIQTLNVKYVNLSGGGPSRSSVEEDMIREMKNTTFVVAAGNNNGNIDVRETAFYPAAYNLGNIVPVGGLTLMGKKTKTSNYGPSVRAWELGDNVLSTLPNGKLGRMTGTSMSAAIHTGKLLYGQNR
jgi:subtilisin family serine protease